MRTADALSCLARHQDIIGRQIARAEAFADAGPDHAHDLSRMRWELTRMLLAYQRFKHSEIFDPAIATGRLADVALARMLKTRCVAAGQVFQRYVLRWSGRDLTGEWDGYTAALHTLAESLRAHMAFERANIARALEMVEDTRRRA